MICVDKPNALDAAAYASEAPSFISLYEISTANITRIAKLGTPRSVVLSASTDGTWVVWSEAADDPNYFDWRLRAYDLRTGDVTEIARAARHHGPAVAGPMPIVSISRGVAVWGQAIREGTGPSRMANAVVREAELPSGVIRTLATSAGMPSLSWPWIAWGVSEADGGYMQVTNLESGFARQLEIRPPQFVLNGESAVYNDAMSLSLWLIDDVSQSSPAVLIGRGVTAVDHIEWPTFNDRIVGWAVNGSSIVYDRAERRLVTLPISSGWSSVTVAGPLMIWEERDPTTDPYRQWPDRLMVVNTETLPIR